MAKLILCGLAFFAGMMVGGVITRSLNLTAPAMPAGTDMAGILIYTLVISPVLALGLAILSGNLAGGFLLRTFVLSFLMWIANTVSNQLDAWLYMPASVDLRYASVSALSSSLFCGATVAWLFPSSGKGERVKTAVKNILDGRFAGTRIWRLGLAAVAFVPIYYFFGLIAIQFTGAYYQQNMYGLRLAGLDLVLPIQFLRSLLFLLACVPVLLLWQESTRRLVLYLGLSLFILIGLQTASAYWLPLTIRLPHTIEILADELVYAATLVLLLFRRGGSRGLRKTILQQTAPG